MSLVGLLNPVNSSWAKDAAALVIVFSKMSRMAPGAKQETPAYNHSFDAGAAWASLALQATRSGWQAHCMAGFDRTRAASELLMPEGYRVEAAVAIGKPGDKAQLSEELQAREIPSLRNPLSAIAFEGMFPR